MKNRRALSLGLLSLLSTVAAVAQTAPPLLTLTPEPPRWEDRSADPKSGVSQGFEAGRLRQAVADLPAAATADQVELALFEVLPQVYKATNRDLPVVAEIVAGLRQQPGAVEAMARQYKQLPADAIDHRLMVLGILGEMKRPDALAQLREVVWAPLPPAEKQTEKLSARDLEEMVQVKAVQGLAYLKTPQASAAVREVIVSHEALPVRVSAIDAYMWNHGDRPGTAAELYRLLPEELHPYVERPRFHRGQNAEEFTRRLAAWQEKWGTQPQSDPKSAEGQNGGEK